MKRRVLSRIARLIAGDLVVQGMPGHRHTYPAFRFLSFALGYSYPPPDPGLTGFYVFSPVGGS